MTRAEYYRDRSRYRRLQNQPADTIPMHTAMRIGPSEAEILARRLGIYAVSEFGSWLYRCQRRRAETIDRIAARRKAERDAERVAAFDFSGMSPLARALKTIELTWGHA